MGFRKNRTLYAFIFLVFASLFVAAVGGCGMVHGTDGRTTTIVGFGRTTEGQVQSEVGIGKGMDTNLSHARNNTFSNRSAAASSVLGGN